MINNTFVDYLNTMHNANANNENAIAESQITNEYYSKIMVKRDVGKYLLDNVLRGIEPCTVVLTGHAGDGKTSLLVQVLKEIGSLNDGECLKEYDSVKLTPDRNLFYVKDISELTQTKQDELLKHSLDETKKNNCSIVISNTGPLINTFKRLFKENKNQVEMQILEKMDLNDGKFINICDYKILIMNMAQLDNTNFIPQIIDNIMQKDLWAHCVENENCENCPIKMNYKLIIENLDRVKAFVRNYYRWQFFNGNRATIRQIISHVSFSITGNLNCRVVKENSNDKFILEYNFANLFFGYKGKKEVTDAFQIKGIRDILNLELDKKKISRDYDLFVKEKFELISPSVQTYIKDLWQRNRTSLNREEISPEEFLLGDESTRREIKRVYFFFHNVEKTEDEVLLNELYSDIYPLYINAISNDLKPKELNNFKNIVFEALHRIFTGQPSENNEKLYLTVRREDDFVQNVQLVRGELSKEQLIIKQVLCINPCDSNDRFYKLVIKFKDETFELTLPLLKYFYDTYRGIIKTRIDPQLSHGVDRLKESLLQNYQYNYNETNYIKLLMSTSLGLKVVKMQLDQDILSIVL